MALVRFAEQAAPELRDLAAADATVLWPIGSTEQHGAHLVTGFDLASATAVCERAADLVERTVVLIPGQAFGSSDHWLPLGATISLRPETLIEVIHDVARSLAVSGFPRLLIVNGHAGNAGPMLTVAGSARHDQISVETISYWTLVDAARVASECRVDGGGIGHAGEVETSIALELGRGLFREDRLPAAAGFPLTPESPGGPGLKVARAPRPLQESPGGVYGDPGPARAELGRLVLDEAARALAEYLR